MNAQPEEVREDLSAPEQIAAQLDELDNLIAELDRLYGLAAENGFAEIADAIGGDLREASGVRKFLANFAARLARKSANFSTYLGHGQ